MLQRARGQNSESPVANGALSDGSFFGLAVQHLDLEIVHSHWPTKRYPKSGETGLPDNLKYEETYEAEGVESVIAKDHDS